MKNLVKTSAMLLAMMSMAQANVSINSASFQEQTKVDANGKKVKEWVKASKVVPGTVIRYVNSLENSGEKSATKLVVNNPVPENMEYVANSASCESGCAISYSVDGGKTYKQPEELFLGVGEERHVAQASEYTAIRWVVDSLAATSQSAVEYKARLK
jgi:uncharacterized repeat protein (TIGR01451 family)